MSLRRKIDFWLKKFEKDFVTHNRIEVSKGALNHNIDLFARLTSKQIIPVLKGNAYGHGIELVASAIKNAKVPYIAVDGYYEALRVREVSHQPVLIMGAISDVNFSNMNYDNFAFVVGDEATIRGLGDTGKPINVHIECNTGMNRYGAKFDEIKSLTKLIISYKNLKLEGLMSHLADSDGEDPATVDIAVDQFDSFVEAVRGLGANPTILHIAQSAGSVKAKSKYANAVRLGIGLYGINPFSPHHKLHNKLGHLKPALKLVSTITKTIELKKGDKVSYNYTFAAPKDMKIGVLPIGYFEGLNRALSNKGVVKVGNNFAPIVGRVCMNHCMISLDGLNVKEGDEVVVYNNDPRDKNSIDSISKEHGLFNYNLLTSLSPDVRRVLVE